MFEPVTDRGLQPNESLHALHGRRVRITGYMVRQDVHQPGLLLIAPQAGLSSGRGCATTLPPTSVHVVIVGLTQPIPYRPGRLSLRGMLSVGPQVMPDGRASIVQLHVDAAELNDLFGEGHS